MKEGSDREPTAKTEIKASEVTSAMVHNASASGDGSIKRSEEEETKQDKDARNNNKCEDDEGII